MRWISLLLLTCLLSLNVLAPLTVRAEGEDDPLWNRPSFEKKVFTVGQRILQANGITERIAFRVDHDDTVNAYAQRWGAPGTVTIHKGLLNFIDNDDELAAVLGHEIAHIIKRHSRKQATTSALIKTGLAAIIIASAVVANDPSGADSLKKLQYGSVVPASMSRTCEEEADLVGMDYLVQAGYSPLAMETLMTKITADAGAITRAFSTHPLGTARISAIRKHIETNYPQFLTPEVAGNLPGAPFQLQSTEATTDDETPASEATSAASATSAETAALYEKLNLIAKQGQASSAEASDQPSPGGGEATSGGAQPGKDVAEKAATSPLKADQEKNVADTLTGSDSKATPLNTPGQNASFAAPQKVNRSVPANALKAPPKRVQQVVAQPKSATSAVQPATQTAAAAEPSVAQLLLSLKPDELRFVKLLSQEELLDSVRLKEEFGTLGSEAFEILVNTLQQKKLVRVIGTAPKESYILTERAAAELNQRH